MKALNQATTFENATMDELRDQQRLNYVLCRLGLAILSFGLIVASISTLLSLPGAFRRGLIPGILGSEFWFWLDSTIPWSCLFGAYLLWGRWDHPSWQRRTGLFLMLNLVDVILWLTEHGDRLGLGVNDFGHPWFRHNLGQALGWAEFALIASLCGDLLIHLGVERASEAGKATRSLAATGAAVWMILFLMRTDWKGGWPLGQRRFINMEMLLLYLGSTLIWTVTLIQATSLAIAATRQCHEVVTEMRRDDELLGQFASPQDPDFDASPGPSWAD
ncbi:MAG: hypothetical protein AB7I30_09810 [Isosphaeraceae bacterium]